ncbi:MAG: hypothetical protein MK207_09375 [Saprospiraceae bacterium]|nr:hypothetical protein [Saprospiraceae bacterium]
MINQLLLFFLVASLTISCTNDEDRAWNQALFKNSDLAIDSFMIKYPNSKYTSEASDFKEKLAWASVLETNTVYSYKKYLADYPSGKFKDLVPQQLNSILSNNINLDELTKSTFIGKINYGSYETQILTFKFANILKDSSGIRFLAKINTSEIRKDIEGRIDPDNFLIMFMEDPKDKSMLNITDGRAYMKENKIILESTNINQYWHLVKYNE